MDPTSPPSPLHPLDLDSASEVVSQAHSQFITCAMSFGPVAQTAALIIGKHEEVRSHSQTWGQEVWDGLLVAAGLVILFFGFASVRPVNFAFGTYLGGSLSLLLMTLFGPLQADCAFVFGVPLMSALASGLLFVWKESSMFAVFGLFAGELAGRLVFDFLLAPTGAPDYLAYSCIGFFSVVVRVASDMHVGRGGGAW